MLVLVTYDVSLLDENGTKRLRKVARLCMNYGQRVQNSVFECILDNTQLTQLRHQIDGVIDKENDSVRFYCLGSNWVNKVIPLGKITSYNPTEELII